MHRLTLIALLALAACARPEVGTFRDANVPIWSAAAFDLAQTAGTWRQAAVYAAAPDGCTGGGVDIAPTAGGLTLSGALCLDGKLQRVDGVARPTGPGRFSVPGQEDWWILWVDSGYRTLAVGTPSGRFGFILDRGALPADRLVAAREVFDFNGYDPAALRPL